MASKKIHVSDHFMASPHAPPSSSSSSSAKSFLTISKRSAKSVLLAMKRSSRFRHIACLAMVTVLGAVLVPSIARCVFPLVHLNFLVLIPQFWNSLLRWLTPPCLFFLLNCIIMILTATSGILKNSGAGGSEFYTELVVKLESRQKHQIVPLQQHPFQDSKPKATTVPSVKEQLILVAKKSTVEEQRVKEKSVTEKPLLANVDKSAASGRHARSKAERIGSERATLYTRRVRKSESEDSSRSTGVERSSSSSSLIVVELSDEELKSRIEDFIARFNAQIRQESLKRCEERN